MDKSRLGEYVTMNFKHFLLSCNLFWRERWFFGRYWAISVDCSYSISKESFLFTSEFFSIFLIYWFFTFRLKRVLFNPSSRMAREVACQMVESFCSKDFQRKKQIIEMLTTFLGDMSHAGEAAQEFVHLYQRLITPDQVRLLLNLLTPNMAVIHPLLTWRKVV